MLRLIERLVPAPLHRAALRLAHRTRHYWRRVVKPRLAGVSIIATNHAGEILLVRHSYGPANWALPGGGCGTAEDPAEAARREMREELAVGLHDLTLVARIEEVISGAPHVAHVFSCVLSDQPQPDRREILEARFFARDALPQPINRIATVRLRHWMALEQR